MEKPLFPIDRFKKISMTNPRTEAHGCKIYGNPAKAGSIENTGSIKISERLLIGLLAPFMGVCAIKPSRVALARGEDVNNQKINYKLQYKKPNLYNILQDTYPNS
jgi:hypothetical protein